MSAVSDDGRCVLTDTVLSVQIDAMTAVKK